MKRFSEMLKEAMQSDNFEKEIEKLMNKIDEIYAKIIVLAGDEQMNEKDLHFTPQTLKVANSKLMNEDGTSGAHWTLEETNRVMKENNIIQNEKFNQFDFNYVMNMIYSDYSQLLGNDTMNYVKMAKFFLNDKDAPIGKAMRYYIAMNPKDKRSEEEMYYNDNYDYDDVYSRAGRRGKGRGSYSMRGRGRNRRYDNGYIDMEDDYDSDYDYDDRYYRDYDIDYDDRYERSNSRNMMRNRRRY